MSLDNFNVLNIELITQFARGIVAGLYDTDLEDLLDDYWHAYDEKYDINIWTDTDGTIKGNIYYVNDDDLIEYEHTIHLGVL